MMTRWIRQVLLAAVHADVHADVDDVVLFLSTVFVCWTTGVLASLILSLLRFYVCVCICICICIYLYTHIYGLLNYQFTRVSTHAHIYAQIQQVRMYVCLCTTIDVNIIQYVYTQMYICI